MLFAFSTIKWMIDFQSIICRVKPNLALINTILFSDCTKFFW